MSIIDTQNGKQIRDAMEVHCGLSAQDTGASLSYSGASGMTCSDSNLSAALSMTAWDMRKLTDFQKGGFPLDGSRKLLDSTAASLSAGKIGMRSHVGRGFSVKITANKTIAAVTVACTAGTGTISAQAGTETKSYVLRRITVIPVNSTAVTLTVSNTGNGRIEIASIVPGISMEWDNSSIISCNVNLRSDLSMDNPSWQISDIEISAYWPDDISEAISNMADDVPIWYYAGYPGDFSSPRFFYLSEAAKMEQNTITLKGEDASSKLEDVSVPIEMMNTVAKSGKRALYDRFVSFVRQAGIKPVSVEASPSESGTSATGRTFVWTEQSCRSHVANIMNLTHVGDFYPTFVDAGIPTIRWRKPTPKWTVFEEDCGEISRNVNRNITKIISEDDDHGLVTTISRSDKWIELSKGIKVTAGVPVIKNYAESNDGWFWSYSVTNQKIRNWSRINSLCFTPAKTSVQKTIKLKEKYKSGKKKGKHKTKKVWKYLSAIKGKKMTVTTPGGGKAVTDTGNRPGYIMKVTPIVYGQIYQGSELIFPVWKNLFLRSNIAGQFTFRGDPRMQPRDVFYFVPKEITKDAWSKLTESARASYVCTLENIQITHEGGGTQAEVTYRKGVC